jgi:chitinase
LYPALQALKQKNGSLKTLLSIGGWSINSGDDKPSPGDPHPYGPYTYQLFSKMAADPQARTQFITSAIAYARKYGFDGIDIDWEYPGYVGRGGGPNDLDNFLALVQEFRATAGSGFLLTMAAPAIVPTGLPQAYHDNPGTYFQWLQRCSQSFDWLNIMSYDYHGAFDGVNSPLPQDSTPNGPFSIKQTVDTYLAAGISPDKMVLGMPTYGRSFKVANPGELASKSGYGQPFSGPAPAGPATQTPGVLAYYEIAKQIASGGLTQKWDAPTLTPYAYSATSGEWVSYDNPDSLAYKTAYVNARGLGGAMVWSIDDDDFANGYPLITKVKDIIDHPEHGPQLPAGLLTGGLAGKPGKPPVQSGDLTGKAGQTQNDTDYKTNGTPGIAVYKDVLFAVFEDRDKSTNAPTGRIWYTGFKNGKWESPNGTNTNFGTTGAPALIVYKDKLHAFHEGFWQNGQLWYMRGAFDGGGNFKWEDDKNTGFGTTGAPALAVYKDKLYCVHLGARPGNALWWASFDGEKWTQSDTALMKQAAATTPSLGVWNNKLYCVYQGTNNGEFWYVIYDGNSWTTGNKTAYATYGAPSLGKV